MNRGWLPGVLLIVIGVLGLWFLSSPAGPPGWVGGSLPLRGGFSSNGERIYYTGTSERTGRIPFEGGPMWLSMHGGGCVSCHGPQGRGGFPVVMGTKIPPDIRYSALTGEDKHEGEEHEDHPPYTDETIKRAIVRGIDPAGKPLDWTMPRWYMTDADLNDLIAYLKRLR